MEIEINRRGRGPGSWVAFVPGAACILFGILILLMPEILVALVAGASLLLGAFLVSIAWSTRDGGRRGLFAMFEGRGSR